MSNLTFFHSAFIHLRRLLIACIILCTTLALLMQSAGADERLQVTSPDAQLIVDQRGIVSLRFELVNTTGAGIELLERLQLPQGWGLVNNQVPFRLEPGQRSMRLIHLLIPPDSAAGQYSVAYWVGSTRDGGLQQQEAVSIQVTSRQLSQLDILNKPANLLPGEFYQASFVLGNKGNTPQQYTTRIKTPDGLLLDVQPAQLSLEANQTAVITVSGQLPADYDYEAHEFTLQLISEADRFKKRVSIPVLTRTPEGVGSHHRLQGELQLGYLGQQSKDGDSEQHFSLQYKARGSLDEAGEHRVAIDLSSGYNPDQPFTDIVDRYRVEYEHQDLKVTAGHQSFYADRLSGNTLSGQGVEVEYQLENPEAGRTGSVRGYYAQSRDNVEQPAQAVAIIAEQRLEEHRLDFGATVLHHETDKGEQGVDERTIISSNARWTGEDSHVQAALAHDGEHDSVLLEAGRNWEDMSANLGYLQSDTGFKGAKPDTRQLNLNGLWKVSDQTHLSASARQTENNLEGDSKYEQRIDEEQRLLLSHALNDTYSTRLGAGIRHRKSRDAHSASDTRQSGQSGVLSYESSIDTISVRAQLEAGMRRDERKNSKVNGQRQQLAVNWQLNPGVTVSADINHHDRLENDSKTLSAGVRGEFRPDPKTQVTAYIRQNRGEQEQSTTLQADFKKRLRNHHQLSLQLTHQMTASKQNSDEDDSDSTLFLNYVVPLAIPLQRRNNIATVCGTIQYPDQQPASNLVLRLGQYSAVSSGQGAFCFPDVLAKSYTLQLDVTRLQGKSYLLGETGNTRTIDLKAGDYQKLALTLRPAASISGRVQRREIDSAAALANQQKLRQGKGVAHVMVELRYLDTDKQPQPILRKTDGQGNFSAAGLIQGRWQLTLAPGKHFPEHYILEKTRTVLELGSGQHQEVIFNAFPVQQQIEKSGPKQGFSVAG